MRLRFNVVFTVFAAAMLLHAAMPAAQSLGELAAAEAKRRAASSTAPAGSRPATGAAAGTRGAESSTALTAEERANLDRTRFARVYAASVAFRHAVLSKEPREKVEDRLLTLDAEVNRVRGATRAERRLVSDYMAASANYRLALAHLSPAGDARDGMEAFRKAFAHLDAADLLYEGK